MLAAPPAADMTYVSPLTGLDPSVYGGGGSPSSISLLDPSLSLLSLGSAAFVSATTVGTDDEDGASNGGAGAKVGGESGARVVTKTLYRSARSSVEGK